MSKVSILVPIYNVEKYLRECLDSLINQTLDDIEIICINDGSTDNSAQILQEYRFKDKRIKVINKENSGYGISMNIGLNSATGEYIGIVESDDFADLKMFEDLYNLAKEKNADIVKSDWLEYTTSTGAVRKAGRMALLPENKDLNVKDNPEILKIQPAIWSAIYRKELLTENNIRFTETAGASYQDTGFAFKVMCLAKNVVLTDKAYIYYRQDNLNSSVKSTSKVYAICTEYAEITKFLNEHKELKPYVNNYKLVKEYVNYMWNLKRIDKQFRKEFIEKISDIFSNYKESGEISTDFFKKVNRHEFNMLISDTAKFEKHIDKLVKKEQFRELRKKLFSIHINKSRFDITLFGKQIVRVV